MSSNLDIIIDSIGLGKWQLLTVMQPLLMVIGSGSQSAIGSIVNAFVPFRCLSTSNQDKYEYEHLNISEDGILIEIGDYNDTQIAFEIETCQSNVVAGRNLNPDLPSTCQNILYDTSSFTSSFNMEFNLVCDRQYLSIMFQSLYFLGYLMGAAFSGPLSDRYGRKLLIRYGFLCMFAVVVAIPFANEVWQILCIRLLSGLFYMLVFQTSYCLALELSPQNRRGMIGVLPGIGYGLAVSGAAIIGNYYIKDWKLLFFLTNAGVFILLPSLYFMEESPRWLVQQGRMPEAQEMLKKAAIMNNSAISGDKISLLLQESANVVEETKPSQLQAIISMFKSKLMLRSIIVMSLVRICIQSVYYGITFNASHFTKDNVYLYLGLIGVTELGTATVASAIASLCKRRLSVCAALMLCSCLLVLDMVIPTDLMIVRWVFVMMSYLIVGTTFHIAYIYSPELFPTEVRGQGISFTNLSGNIGSSSAPIIASLLGPIWWGVPTTLGTIAMVGGIMVWLLPETKGTPLFTTIKECELAQEKKQKITEKEKEIEV